MYVSYSANAITPRDERKLEYAHDIDSKSAVRVREMWAMYTVAAKGGFSGNLEPPPPPP